MIYKSKLFQKIITYGKSRLHGKFARLVGKMLPPYHNSKFTAQLPDEFVVEDPFSSTKESIKFAVRLPRPNIYGQYNLAQLYLKTIRYRLISMHFDIFYSDYF